MLSCDEDLRVERAALGLNEPPLSLLLANEFQFHYVGFWLLSHLVDLNSLFRGYNQVLVVTVESSYIVRRGSLQLGHDLSCAKSDNSMGAVTETECEEVRCLGETDVSDFIVCSDKGDIFHLPEKHIDHE